MCTLCSVGLVRVGMFKVVSYISENRSWAKAYLKPPQNGDGWDSEIWLLSCAFQSKYVINTIYASRTYWWPKQYIVGISQPRQTTLWSWNEIQIFCCWGDLSYGPNTLGPLCLWQCLIIYISPSLVWSAWPLSWARHLFLYSRPSIQLLQRTEDSGEIFVVFYVVFVLCLL